MIQKIKLLPVIVLGIFISLLLLSRCATSGKDLAGELDYNFHIRPILSDKCFACHGPDANKREAGLRLDTEEGAYSALKESPGMFAIVPGNKMNSALGIELTLRILRK